jgi:cytidylate kinase
MNIDVQQCLSYIGCQLGTSKAPKLTHPVMTPSVTISRMTGSGARAIAAKLAEFLQREMPTQCSWTVFDRTLMERVMEDHHLPKRMAEALPESHKPLLTDTIEELFGLHPPTCTMVQQTAETIWHIAQMGSAIIVGRGANVIAARLENVFHVRLVGSLECRVARLMQTFGMSEAEARDLIHKEDTGRRKYLRDHFEKNIEDPLLYHVVINTDRIEAGEVAEMIGTHVARHFKPVPEALAMN